MEFTPETFAQIGIQANDLDGINAAIKALNLMKKEGKEAFAAQAKAAKKVADAEAFAHGKELLANAKVGDIATPSRRSVKRLSQLSTLRKILQTELLALVTQALQRLSL